MLKKILLAIVLLSSTAYANSGSLYIKLSDGFFAGTEYTYSTKTTYIKSNIETKIQAFSEETKGFVPEKVIYNLELGHKINDEIEFIYRHQCPHTIDGFHDYEYINYNEFAMRSYTK